MIKKIEPINYYELLAKLKEFEYRLLGTNDKQTSCFDVDIIISNAKAYIFNNKELKEEFLKRQTQFYKSTQTIEYKNRYKKVYKEIKEHSKKQAQEKERTLNYVAPYSEESDFMPSNAIVKGKEIYHPFIDRPEHYYFPSIRASYIRRSNMPLSDEDFTNLKILPSLESFYLGIDLTIAQIRVYNGTQPKTKQEFINKQKEIEDTIILIPKDLEFYIASGDYKVNQLFDSFKFCFYATSICYVLNELQKFVQSKIYKTYYKNEDNPDLNNDIKTLEYKNEALYKFLCLVKKRPEMKIKEIATELGIVESTVSKYCQKICDKFSLTKTKGIETIRKFVKNIDL